jgi:hypothetical protein
MKIKIKIDFFYHNLNCGRQDTMVWTMWQGWHDENQARMRVERELKNLTTLFHRVVKERDSLKEQCYELEEENKRLRNS